jgi:hypothetical protein
MRGGEQHGFGIEVTEHRRAPLQVDRKHFGQCVSPHTRGGKHRDAITAIQHAPIPPIDQRYYGRRVFATPAKIAGAGGGCADLNFSRLQYPPRMDGIAKQQRFAAVAENSKVTASVDTTGYSAAFY